MSKQVVTEGDGETRELGPSPFEPWPQRILVLVAILAVPAVGASLIPSDEIARMVCVGFGYPAFLGFVAMGGGIAMTRWRAVRWSALALIVPFLFTAIVFMWTIWLDIDNMDTYMAFVAICGWVMKACIAAFVGLALAGWIAWWRACRSGTPVR